MSTYAVFDSHCDTPYELWRKKQRFDQTDCHVSLQKARTLPGYAQFFAFCTLAGQTGGYTCQELLLQPYAYFAASWNCFTIRFRCAGTVRNWIRRSRRGRLLPSFPWRVQRELIAIPGGWKNCHRWVYGWSIPCGMQTMPWQAAPNMTVRVYRPRAGTLSAGHRSWA